MNNLQPHCHCTPIHVLLWNRSSKGTVHSVCLCEGSCNKRAIFRDQPQWIRHMAVLHFKFYRNFQEKIALKLIIRTYCHIQHYSPQPKPLHFIIWILFSQYSVTLYLKITTISEQFSLFTNYSVLRIFTYSKANQSAFEHVRPDHLLVTETYEFNKMT